MYQQSYELLYRYTRTKDGITIPVILGRAGVFEKVEAKVDTGAEYCLFRREVGEALEIEIESGLPKTFSVLTGSLDAYGHDVVLQSFDFLSKLRLFCKRL